MFTIEQQGDLSLLCRFQDDLTPEVHQNIMALEKKIRDVNEKQVNNIIPIETTLTINFDSYSAYDKIYELLDGLKNNFQSEYNIVGKHHNLAACYDIDYHNQDVIKEYTGLNLTQLVDAHTSETLYQYNYGGSPGVLRLGKTSVTAPGRLEKVNVGVPPVSVGWSSNFCNTSNTLGSYNERRQGWPIICRILPSKNIWFIKPGDTVKFYPITRKEYEEQLSNR